MGPGAPNDWVRSAGAVVAAAVIAVAALAMVQAGGGFSTLWHSGPPPIQLQR